MSSLSSPWALIGFHIRHPVVPLAIFLALGSLLNRRELPAADPVADREFFESRIRPVLLTQCYECHNSRDPEAGLALDHQQGLLVGGDSGPAVVPRDLQSLLLKAIRHDDDALRMPVGKPKLPPQVIADFERWISSGAMDPRTHPPTAEELAPEKLRDSIFQLRKRWWSFQPIAPPPLPNPPDNASPLIRAWSKDPIDRWLLTSMLSHELTPSEQAEPATLIRRLSYALTGLPPATEDVERFIQDPSDESYASLVDKYLQSITYAERWSRHWMDWIRFAESHGSEGDPTIPFAYRYRDYLIRAIKEDVPIDQLIREHLAGDLMPKPRINESLGINESAIGPAHLRMVFHGFAPTDAMEEKVRFIDDQINTVTKAFLGLTVSCARCHDHKFDAITQADYYALFGIFGSCRPGTINVNLASTEPVVREQLEATKLLIRNALAKLWLEQIDPWSQDFTDPDSTLWQRVIKAEKQDSVLHPWKLALGDPGSLTPSGLTQPLAPPVTQHMEQLRRQIIAINDWRAKHSVDGAVESKVSPLKDWFTLGNGTATNLASSGNFSVALTGDQLLTDIYPQGIYSHLHSTRDANVFMSPRIAMDDSYQLAYLVAGSGNAVIRYVVRDYPRDGTVYPATRLSKPEWNWQTHSLGYWEGDEIHLEATTAADGAVLNTNNPHSWFGIRDVVIFPQGEPGPPSAALEHFALLTTAFDTHRPQSLADFTKLLSTTTREAIEAWQNDSANDDQALWLSALLREGLLANQFNEAAAVQPLIMEYRECEASLAEPTRVPGVLETVGIDQHLFARGEHKHPLQSVPRGFLSAIDPSPYQTAQSGRLQFAESLVSPRNPLTSRVMVNRIWHHLFGAGLVRTPDNFGAMGFEPTHPALLDHLAQDLRQEGWSLRRTIRSMVLSRAWRQASQPSETAQRLDPENTWWSHARLHRLDAESIRDTLLTLSGSLDQTPYGPSVDGGQSRRSVYVRVQRNALDPLLRVFDFPEPATTTGRRDETNVPAQALALLNDKRVLSEARLWADQILKSKEQTFDDRLQLMFLRALARPPRAQEAQMFQAFLEDLRQAVEEENQAHRELSAQLSDRQTAIQQILGPARQRLLNQREKIDRPIPPQPLALYEFNNLKDAKGSWHGELKGGAKLEAGHLVLDGIDDYFTTGPLHKSYKEKTLEAWVQVSDLAQRGGGVVSLQSSNGAQFDSLVFGEQNPKVWMAGSNSFRRTQPFVGAVEETITDRPVHVAIVYRQNGTIEGYREGEAYGKPYQANGRMKLSPEDSILTVGVRHLPTTGNRMFRGRVDRVQFYNRALSAEEIQASYLAYGDTISDLEIMNSLSQAEQDRLTDLRREAELLREALIKRGPIDQRNFEQRAWTEVARSIFCLKEFMFIQ